MPDPISRLHQALEGRCLVERSLGEGGMAAIYLARDLVVGAERFLAEIETTAVFARRPGGGG